MTQTNYKTIRKRNQISLDDLRALDAPDPKYIVAINPGMWTSRIIGIFSSEEAAIKREVNYLNEKYNTRIAGYTMTDLLTAMKRSGVIVEIVECIIDDENTDLILH